MVHSAVKRQLIEKKPAVPLDGVEVDHPIIGYPFVNANTYAQDDPKELLQATLKYLSDEELSTLIITRLSKAVPRKSPLYLTTLCIEGLHDFFRPQSPITDSVHGIPETPDSANNNPFSRMPITRHDSERLTGKFNIPGVRKNSPALLLSLATLFSFLEPSELRNVIQNRLADSTHPHVSVQCFLDFLQSGGDDTPRGKSQLQDKRATLRDNLKAKKAKAKLDAEQAEGSKSAMTMGSRESLDVNASRIGLGSSNHTLAGVDLPLSSSFVDVELEDGEISAHIDSDPSISVTPCYHPSTPAPPDKGSVTTSLAGHNSSCKTPALPPAKKRKIDKDHSKSGTTLPLSTSSFSTDRCAVMAPLTGDASSAGVHPPKKKRKRKSNAARRAPNGVILMNQINLTWPLTLHKGTD